MVRYAHNTGFFWDIFHRHYRFGRNWGDCSLTDNYLYVPSVGIISYHRDSRVVQCGRGDRSKYRNRIQIWVLSIYFIRTSAGGTWGILLSKI